MCNYLYAIYRGELSEVIFIKNFFKKLLCHMYNYLYAIYR